MVKVGITGGIGSGKSLISRLFAMIDIPVYNADERAKYLMSHNKVVKDALVSRFGNLLYEDDELNRSLLAGIIFNDNIALSFVNSIVHPAVGIDYLEWINKIDSYNYCIKEAALIFESGLYKELDCIITVVCPEEKRIQRVMLRDNVSYDLVLARIRNQWSDKEKMKLADYIIFNDDNNSVIEQVLQINRNILKKI